MTDQDKLLRLAKECGALDWNPPAGPVVIFNHADLAAFAAALLAGREAEPVAHCNLQLWGDGSFEAQDCFSDKPFEGSEPLYAAHPAPKAAEPAPMTDEQAGDIARIASRENSYFFGHWIGCTFLAADCLAMVRAVEAHHGITAKESP